MAVVLPPKNTTPQSNNFNCDGEMKNAIGAILPPKSFQERHNFNADGGDLSPMGIDYNPTPVKLIAAAGGLFAGIYIAGKNGYGMLGGLAASALTGLVAYGIASAATTKK